MRQNKRWLKTVHLKLAITIEDDEGGKYTDYSKQAKPIKVNIQPAKSLLQSEVYGQRVNSILNAIYTGKEIITEGDGVCVYVASESLPDYKVISVKPWPKHKLIELEKI